MTTLARRIQTNPEVLGRVNVPLGDRACFITANVNACEAQAFVPMLSMRRESSGKLAACLYTRHTFLGKTATFVAFPLRRRPFIQLSNGVSIQRKPSHPTMAQKIKAENMKSNPVSRSGVPK